MTRPRLLDLFCGAGGAAMGYHRAGFDVVGVDLAPQPHYPFEFHQADALDYLRDGVDRIAAEFTAVHASPPCQAFSSLRSLWPDRSHPDHIDEVRGLLRATGLPYVIENVGGAPLLAPQLLCGTMFDLGTEVAELRRHRLFEVRPPIFGLISGCRHGWRNRVIGVYGGHGHDSRRRHSGQSFTVAERRIAMGIDWMTGGELAQAIPPAYTEWIGARLLAALPQAVA